MKQRGAAPDTLEMTELTLKKVRLAAEIGPAPLMDAVRLTCTCPQVPPDREKGA